jgi:putative sigma-54 modulation protein
VFLRYNLGMEQVARIDVRTRGFRPTAALRAHAEREVRRSLGHVRKRAGEVTLFLSDLNGPRGGADKLCRIGAHLHRSGVVFASASGTDLYEAIAKAASRLRRLVSHALGRRRRPRPWRAP